MGVLTSSDVGMRGLVYGLKLTPYIERNAARLSKLDRSAREESVRRAWARVKSKEGISTTGEVDSTVVSAALETLRKRAG